MKNRLISANSRMPKTAENGYILPLVIITGVILGVGAVILSARSFSGLIRSSRQKQRNEAIEIAETGQTAESDATTGPRMIGKTPLELTKTLTGN